MKAWTSILAITLAGCAASGTQVSQQTALQFKEGVTTETEVMHTLGQPTGVTVSAGKKFLTYTGMQTRIKAATFIPIVGAFAGGADYQMTNAMYQFDNRGVLEKVTYSSSGSGSRSGSNPADMPPKEPTAR